MRRAALRRLVLPALLLVSLLPPAAHAQSGPVLVVGDSLEVGTGPHLRRQFSSVPVTVDARTGRPSSEGVRVLRERLRPGHKVVVFDLGTNDDPSRSASFARNLQSARKIAGDRCLVVSTINRPPVGGVSVGVMNRTVEAFADATPDAMLVDWEGAVERDPSLLASDRVHATPAGYVARARLVAAAIEECFGAVDPPARTPREAPEPEPGPQPSPRAAGRGADWGEVLALTPYDVIAGWVRVAADIVVLAGQNVAGAFGEQPPEVELGAPPPKSKP